jgi:hypothetical protein
MGDKIDVESRINFNATTRDKTMTPSPRLRQPATTGFVRQMLLYFSQSRQGRTVTPHDFRGRNGVAHPPQRTAGCAAAGAPFRDAISWTSAAVRARLGRSARLASMNC